jgi:hypothetical protein
MECHGRCICSSILRRMKHNDKYDLIIINDRVYYTIRCKDYVHWLWSVSCDSQFTHCDSNIYCTATEIHITVKPRRVYKVLGSAIEGKTTNDTRQ